MIIGMGIVAAKMVSMISFWILLLAGAVLFLMGLRIKLEKISGVIAENKQKRASLGSQQKSLKLADVCKSLQQIKRERPKLASEMDDCLEQTFLLEDLLKRFDDLIRRNNATVVSGARSALEEVERLICGSFDWVINNSLAVGEDGRPDTDIFYDKCREKIKRALNINQDRLDEGNEFLLDLADNVSEGSFSKNSVRFEAWVETVREQNKILMKGEGGSV